MARSRNNLLPQVRVVTANSMPSQVRRSRRPQHRFNVNPLPYEIAPMMIAPVLPGETMQSLLMQARVVTDPVKHPLIGWWTEYYFFYVSHRTMMANGGYGPDITAMMLDTSITLDNDGADPALYQFDGSPGFLQYCLTSIVKEFFRDEDEAYGFPLDQYVSAKMDTDLWCQSLTEVGVLTDDPDLPGVDEQEGLDVLPGFTAQYDQWQLMRDAGMTDLTYEDYLRSYGVSVPKAEVEDDTVKFKPELIRFIRAWQYPTNTVDPSNGTPASAVSWSLTEKADKKRFFKEPGFLVGVTVTRPKMYLGKQNGYAAGLLNNAYGWLPAVLSGFPYTSLKSIDTPTTGGIITDGDDLQPAFWLDYKDLFLYGDQFLAGQSYQTDATDQNARWNAYVASGSGTDVLPKYPSIGEIGDLFASSTVRRVHHDGIVHLNVLSRMADTTP